LLSAIGSPPRAWGQYRMESHQDTSDRFTPTGVGTISLRRQRRKFLAVHPHGRGDNSSAYSRRVLSIGSPPRAWGQYVLITHLRHPSRFTPTGVGTMKTAQMTTSALPVHPHGRGDNDGGPVQIRSLNGSPPRAWGQ